MRRFFVLHSKQDSEKTNSSNGWLKQLKQTVCLKQQHWILWRNQSALWLDIIYWQKKSIVRYVLLQDIVDKVQHTPMKVWKPDQWQRQMEKNGLSQRVPFFLLQLFVCTGAQNPCWSTAEFCWNIFYETVIPCVINKNISHNQYDMKD